MFTGLIQRLGVIASIHPAGQGSRVAIAPSTPFERLEVGESIAVDGACLTVTSFDHRQFTVDVSPESLRRTTLGHRRPGAQVNLERALRLSDRLGGHLVSGHVDGLGRVSRLAPVGEFITVSIEIPESLARHVVEKGSICVDGISLTVVGVSGRLISMAVIPLTMKETTLQFRKVGDAVNVETDLLAKYVEKALTGGAAGGSGGLVDKLRQYGFTD